MQDSYTSASPLALSGKRPVFVVGHPRSGTTLVQLLITAHPVFWSAPETHFFTHVLETIPNWEDRLLRENELPTVFESLAGKPGIVLDDATKTHIMNAAHVAGGIAAASLLDLIMQSFAEKQHKNNPNGRWLEKTPRHVNHLRTILRHFPDARIINIVRDPRDVASSPVRFQELDEGAERRYLVISRGYSWNTMVTVAKDLLPNEPRLMTIRYEDIIIDPEAALERLMQFVGEENTGNVLESFGSNYRNVVLEKEDIRKQLCAVGEIVDRRGIWKKRMTPLEAQYVETICASLMQEYGYELEFEPIPTALYREKLAYEVPIAVRKARAVAVEHTRRTAGKMLRAVGLMPKKLV